MGIVYSEMNKDNTDYETFKKACYEWAIEKVGPEEASEGLDYGDSLGYIETMYNYGYSVSKVVRLLCY